MVPRPTTCDLPPGTAQGPSTLRCLPGSATNQLHRLQSPSSFPSFSFPLFKTPQLLDEGWQCCVQGTQCQGGKGMSSPKLSVLFWGPPRKNNKNVSLVLGVPPALSLCSSLWRSEKADREHRVPSNSSTYGTAWPWPAAMCAPSRPPSADRKWRGIFVP